MTQGNEGALRSAAKDGDVKKVTELIKNGVDINNGNQQNNTALHVGTFYGHEKVVKKLVEAGADLNIQNKLGQTPIQLAAVKNFVNIVKVLTSAGAELNQATGYSGMTALHYASKEGASTTCQLLLDKGADRDLTDFIGKMPEFYAANEATEKVFRRYTSTNTNARKSDKGQNLSAGPKHQEPEASPARTGSSTASNRAASTAPSMASSITSSTANGAPSGSDQHTDPQTTDVTAGTGSVVAVVTGTPSIAGAGKSSSTPTQGQYGQAQHQGTDSSHSSDGPVTQQTTTKKSSGPVTKPDQPPPTTTSSNLSNIKEKSSNQSPAALKASSQSPAAVKSFNQSAAEVKASSQSPSGVKSGGQSDPSKSNMSKTGTKVNGQSATTPKADDQSAISTKTNSQPETSSKTAGQSASSTKIGGESTPSNTKQETTSNKAGTINEGQTNNSTNSKPLTRTRSLKSEETKGRLPADEASRVKRTGQAEGQDNWARAREAAAKKTNKNSYGYDRNSKFEGNKDHEFEWSEEFKARQKKSVFNRLLGK